jgi:hypothetical protein
MKKLLLLLLIGLLTGVVSAQLEFDRFETHPDSNYIGIYASVNDTSRVVLTLENTIVHEGNSALRYDWRAQRAESWGGFAKYEMWHPDSFSVWNFEAYNNLSIWYYNDIPSSDPSRIHLRIQFFDVSDVPVNTYDAGQTELWYSFEYVLDSLPSSGWHQILLPMDDVGGAATQGENGFWRTGWSGVTGNNHLDLDQIKGIGLEVSIDAPQDFTVHTGQIIFDYLTFEGSRELPVVFFNGRAVPSDKTLFVWGGSSAVVEEGTGATPGTNSWKWTQGAGQAWTGFGWDFPSTNLALRWDLDSLKFKIKAPAGTGALRAQFEDGTDKAGIVFTPIADDTWHDYAIPLRDMVYQDGSTSIDTSALTVFQFLAEGTGAGLTMNFDDIWTGDPEIDVIPPAAPLAPVVIPDNKFNLITWLDVANEGGETYNLYYSADPITSLDDPGIEVVEQGLNRPENTGSWSHLLFSPLADSTTTFYYAVTAVDAAGNESDPGILNTGITNVAKGIGTMSLTVPPGFAADGNLSEWSGIQEMRMFPSEGAYIATNHTVTDDADLSVKAYLAADADYLYFAFDVTDDIVDTSAANTYENDSPDLFLGTYNHHGAQHAAYERGAEADYHFRFLPSSIIIDNLGSFELVTFPSTEYHWGEQFPVGYLIEGRMKWEDIASAATPSDDIFDPTNGYRIPVDFTINDNDGTNGGPNGSPREGMMTWSPYNDDTSWQSPQYWLYTWVGDRSSTVVGIEDGDSNVPLAFALDQNYPNPFNPATTIRYQLAEASDVRLDIFNTLGQKVKTIVQERQPAGVYKVKFDARDLSSGIYFYRFSAADFVKVNKMVLMK